jgi:hypothetical protein
MAPACRKSQNLLRAPARIPGRGKFMREPDLSPEDCPTYYWRGDGLPPARVYGNPPAKSWEQFQKMAGVIDDDKMKVYDRAGTEFEALTLDELQAEFAKLHARIDANERQTELFAKRMDNELQLIGERLPE